MTTTCESCRFGGRYPGSSCPNRQHFFVARTDPCSEWMPALPKDGIPRITLHGVELLKQGLAGDFSNWSTEYSYCNHPYSIPKADVSNCSINAAIGWHKDGRNQIIVEPWFGKSYPRVKAQGLNVIPYIEVSRLQYPLVSEDAATASDYITLSNEGDWFNHVVIMIEDRQVWTHNLADEEEDEEDEGMADCPVIAIRDTGPKQVGLDAYL